MNSHFTPVQALVVSISLFAAGGVFGGALHSFWISKAVPAIERELAPTISSAEWSALKASIARIEAQLASSQLSAAGERVEVGASPTTSIDALAQTVRELQGSIAQLRLVAEQAARAIPDVASPHELDKVAREINWPAIAALVELESREKGAALRDVRLSTPNEILRRFGSPTSMIGFDSVHWEYTRPVGTVADSDWLGLSFVFAQGGVVWVNISR